jgi:hypothetical protein
MWYGSTMPSSVKIGHFGTCYLRKCREADMAELNTVFEIIFLDVPRKLPLLENRPVYFLLYIFDFAFDSTVIFSNYDKIHICRYNVTLT